MATLDSIIQFTGRLGNVIAYKRGGKHFLRSRPATVRQTAGTRRAAQWFGAASRKGALVRGAIAHLLDIHCHGSLVNRLNSAIVQAGQNNHAGLVGFSFNPCAHGNTFFTQPLVWGKDGALRIPAQAFTAFGPAVRMEVKLIATRIDFSGRRLTGSDTDTLDIDLIQPFEGARLSVSAPGKGTLVVTLQVRFFTAQGVLRNRKYQSADIVGVFGEEVPATLVASTPYPPVQDDRLPANPRQTSIIQRE